MRGQLDIFQSTFAILSCFVLYGDYDEKGYSLQLRFVFLRVDVVKTRHYTSRYLSIPVYPPRNVFPRHILLGIVNLASYYANG